MNKISLLITFIAILHSSCALTPKKNHNMEGFNISGTDIKNFEHQDCEYIYGTSGYKLGITHKGNCKTLSTINKIKYVL